MNIVDRIKNILTTPQTEFAAIKAEPADIQQIYRDFLVIVAALPAIGTIISFGHPLGFGTRFKMAIAGYLIMLVSFYISAQIINYLAPKFSSSKNLGNALKLVGYSSTPYLVAGLLTFIGALGGLLVLAGGIYSIYLFYLGLPIFMETPRDRVVMYMVVAFVVSLLVYVVLSWLLFPLFGVSMMMQP